MPKIVVLDGYTLNPGDNPWAPIEAHGNLTIHERTAKEDIVSRARDAEIVLTNKTPLTAGTIAELKHLRFIGVLATGHNIVDSAAARARNIPVSNVPVYGTESVAQFTFALILDHYSRVGEHNASVHAGDWARSADWCYWKHPLRELHGKKIGLVGYGRIGGRVADIAHAFGMKVYAANTRGTRPSPDHVKWIDLETLFAESDIVSLHCPLTKDNHGFVNKALLEKMKPDALLINASRGPLINEADLADALNHGKIGAAALDVLSTEPPSPENPLLKAKNCVITPHIAWGPLEARRRIMQTSADNIAAFLKGTPIHVVN